MLQLTVRKMLPSRDKWLIEFRELLHHGRRVGKEEKIEIRVVSGETWYVGSEHECQGRH